MSSIGIIGFTPFFLFSNIIDQIIKIGENNAVLTIVTLSSVD